MPRSSDSAAPQPTPSALRAGFRLGEWTVRPEDGALSSTETDQRLEPLLMELLVYLCSRAGQVVPKQDLLDRVWGGRFVGDDTVKGSFYQLRKALGDDPRKPRFIETLPKRGYRMLIHPVPTAAAVQNRMGEAADLCEKGRAALRGMPEAASLKQARLYFERAVEAARNDAAAFAGLAHTYVLCVTAGVDTGTHLLPRAKAAATRAIELDPALAEAHLAMALIRFMHDRNFAAADEEFQLALRFQSRDSSTQSWYARFLACLGRDAEAIAQAREALACDPLTLPVRRHLVEVLFLARRFDDAIAEAQRLLDIAPQSTDIQLSLVWVYHLQQKDRQAFEAFAGALYRLGVDPAMIDHARRTFETGGIRALFQLWATVLEQKQAMGEKAQNDLLALYALLGNNGRFFELAEQASEQGNPYILWVPVSPLFDGMRADRRYADFAARLGFPPAR